MPTPPERPAEKIEPPERWAMLPNHARNDPSTMAFKKRLAVIIGVYIGAFLIFVAVLVIAFVILKHSQIELPRP